VSSFFLASWGPSASLAEDTLLWLFDDYVGRFLGQLIMAVLFFTCTYLLLGIFSFLPGDKNTSLKLTADADAVIIIILNANLSLRQRVGIDIKFQFTAHIS